MRPAFFIHGAPPPVKPYANRALAAAWNSRKGGRDLPARLPGRDPDAVH